MRRRIAPFFISILCALTIFSCGKKNDEAGGGAAAFDKLPPKGSATDAPDFVRSLSLLYPQSEIYRVDNRILQKTNHHLRDIVAYYEGAFGKHNFKETAKLEQTGGALLQYERSANDVKELISVDISKLPYAENYLIRIGRSEVDYKRGKAE